MDTKIIQLSSGKGPAECCLAVALALKALLQEARELGIAHTVLSRHPGPQNGSLASATLKLSGSDAAAFAKSWEGALLWVCQSPYRRMHKRKNWFIGISVYDESQLPAWTGRDISYQTLRASGPGGQHVNKTESAVRAIHGPSGLSVTASDSRSQLQNKKLATERLHAQFVQWQLKAAAELGQDQWLQHHQLERGNPTRTYKGETFRKEKTYGNNSTAPRDQA